MQLDALQAWMLDAITAPRDVTDPTGHAGLEVAAVIEPTPLLTAAQRLGIYAAMYWERLIEALDADYPALRRYLGDCAFRDTLRRYLQDRPSRHFSLAHLGHDLAEWLAGPPAADPFASELAQLERMLVEVFHEAADPPVTGDALLALRPDDFASARFAPIRASRLLSFTHAVDSFLTATRAGAAVPPPGAGNEHVMVYRQADRVLRHRLEPDAFVLLDALLAGLPLCAAIDHAATTGIDPDRLVGSIAGWFRDWVGRGWFRAITVDLQPPPA